MKLTSKGRYAVMAMADLAKNYVKEPTSLSEISLRQGISLSFLEQLFLRLKKNINMKKKMQGAFDNIFHNIEINIRELGYGDTKVNNTMKSLNNIFYDILTKVDKKEFFLNNDILVLLNKYFYNSEKQDLKKSNDLAKYLDEFQNYCFDLDINNVLNGSLDFKFR